MSLYMVRVYGTCKFTLTLKGHDEGSHNMYNRSSKQVVGRVI